MISRGLSSASLALCLVALACGGGGGTVATYALCGAADTCPSSTTCEPFSATSTSTGGGATFCTWSCQSDGGAASCPGDAKGVHGVCVTSLDGATVGGADDAGPFESDDFGFCFEDCSSGGACPDGETCRQAQSPAGQARVCVPRAQRDPLSGTSWQSHTLTAAAASDDVTMSVYTVTFDAATGTVDGHASGPLEATFTQLFGTSAAEYASCTETTTYRDGRWVDTPPTAKRAGTLTVSNRVELTTRTGCMSPLDDTMGAGEYGETLQDESASYTLSGATMTVAGGTGVTPYADTIGWSFTRK